MRRPLLVAALVAAVVALVSSVAMAVGTLGSPGPGTTPGPSMMHKTPGAGMNHTQAPGAGMNHTQAPGAGMNHP